MLNQVQRLAMFGGGGFIGSNLAAHLANSSSIEPIIFDVTTDKLDIAFGDTGYQFVECDIVSDLDMVDEAIRECDLVMHLAAHVHPNTFIHSPLDIVQLNLFNSLPIVEGCIRHKRKLFHMSTCEVYGKTGGSDESFREDQTDCILGPINNQRWIYSCAKQLLDRMIHAHGLRNELEYTILRPFNFVGPLMDWIMPTPDSGCPRVLAQFVSALIYNRPLQLVNGGESKRCFTYIGDAVSAIEKIILHPQPMKNQIVNIGNPNNEITVHELAHLMRDIYRREFDQACSSEIVDVDGEEFYGAGYEDCDRRMPDISKLTAIGWQPGTDLETTFYQSIKFCVENHQRLMADV